MIIRDAKQAVAILARGELLGLPTETVYGLAGRIDQLETVRQIFTLKERPFFDPLIVHCHNENQVRSLCLEWPKAASILAKAFWPGPLTLVLKKTDAVSDLISSGLSTVGLRVPNHPLALEVLRLFGVPLAAPSANKFGRTSPTSAEHVAKEFGPLLSVLDGGPCQGGIESSIVQVNEDCEILMLRKGLISADQISTTLSGTGLAWRWGQSAGAMAPGKLKHHYMPDKPLILLKNREMSDGEILQLLDKKWAELPDEVEGVKIRKPKRNAKAVFRFQLSQDPLVAARMLYSSLRIASESDNDLIVYSLKTTTAGLWDGIHDRLLKAATFVID